MECMRVWVVASPDTRERHSRHRGAGGRARRPTRRRPRGAARARPRPPPPPARSAPAPRPPRGPRTLTWHRRTATPRSAPTHARISNCKLQLYSRSRIIHTNTTLSAGIYPNTLGFESRCRNKGKHSILPSLL